ncbi:hypothetical protein HAZT_HAZT010422 [Hyalella azteca]|uniref:Protein THEM6 n=1 Tax=Hyalella azteca TaxID=294128 RepID=A0A6A0GZT3_HYAAZ|nr:hypothetical protein HAZT_HAZT010422 [Hyalella azteca]
MLAIVCLRIVTTRDIDVFLTHLNNSRFLRAMDFGRFDHIFRGRISAALTKTKSNALVSSSVIRYRKPLYIFLPYAIDTGVVYWDDRSVYYRQDVRTLHDNFVRGTAYLKVTMIGASPADLLEYALKGYRGSMDWGKTFIPQVLVPASEGGNSEAVETQLPSDLRGAKHFFDKRSLPSDIEAFLRFNEESSLRIKASGLVKGATKEAVKRLQEEQALNSCRPTQSRMKSE